jgi:hypothetical protein
MLLINLHDNSQHHGCSVTFLQGVTMRKQQRVTLAYGRLCVVSIVHVSMALESCCLYVGVDLLVIGLRCELASLFASYFLVIILLSSSN